jgi:hypothetical protein
MALKRDQILEAKDLRTVRVKVREWAVNGEDEVIVASMTGEMRDAWEQSLVDKGGAVKLANVRARLLVFTIVDEDGNRVFSDEDIQLLGKKSSSALERCVKAAQKLNKLTDSDMEEAKGN